MKKNWNCHFLPTRGKWLKSYWLMRNFIILFFALNLSAFANGLSQEVSLARYENATLIEVFEDIKVQTGYGILYKIQDINPDIRVNMNVANSSVQEILSDVLEGTSLDYKVQDEVIVIFKAEIISQPKETSQQKEKKILKGTVTDEKGETLPGVSIVVKGTSYGVSTDINGNYSLKIPEEGGILVFSFVGMTNKEIAYNGQSVIDVTLAVDAEVMEEVVVTGYAIESAERSTGSTTTVTAGDFEKKGQSNIMSSLEGMIAGLGISNDPNNEGSRKISIRGTSTINGDSQPLLVIDGFAVQADISTINPYDVESITVLKDAGSASIYGAKAANGVIVITTKKGKKGKVKVNYNNNFTIHSTPDIAYRMNRASSDQLVDAQMAAATKAWSSNRLHSYEWLAANTPWNLYGGIAQKTRVHNAMTKYYESQGTANEMSESQLNAIVDPYRTLDNTKQLEKYFTQRPVEELHNLTLSGGGEKHLFRATVNYTKTKTAALGNSSERMIFDIVNNIKLTDKMKLDLSTNLTFTNKKDKPYGRQFSVSDQTGDISAGNGIDYLINNVNSYDMFADEAGNPLDVAHRGYLQGNTDSGGTFGGKSTIERQRLIDLGLYDETYRPLADRDRYSMNEKDFRARVQGMFYADIVKGVKANFGFVYETANMQDVRNADAESFEMREMVNNYAPASYSGNDNELWIPRGDRITESNVDSHAYTIRAQLNIDKRINDHSLRAFLGSELKEDFKSITVVDQFGFDDNSLFFQYIDKKALGNGAGVNDVMHPYGYIAGVLPMHDMFKEYKNRYFSLYGNFSYDYKSKYVLSGSVRVDQSNLFGTDPEYRYKPFWSLAGRWNISDEDFFNSEFIDRLALRTSYGINGNIANNYGPFNIATTGMSYSAGNIPTLEVTSPAITNLRWERTATTNFGLDIAMFNHKVKLGLDYYIKDTKDILALGAGDPALGWSYAMRNDAVLSNKGYEVSLSTTNIATKDFRWTSSFLFKYNDNKVDKVVSPKDLYSLFVVGSGQTREGYPVNSLFMYNSAGLSEQGLPMVYDGAGNIPDPTNPYLAFDIPVDDLVYSGTLEEKISGSFNNNISYKNFNLSFMFVFKYGHKLLKDTYSGEFLGTTPQNVNADVSKAWTTPGDEAFTDIPPVNSINSYSSMLSKYSSNNVLDAGFFRLREVILSYNVPKHIMDRLPIESASFNARGNNLWLHANNDAGIDPEAHGFGVRYYPLQPSYSFGVNIGF